MSTRALPTRLSLALPVFLGMLIAAPLPAQEEPADTAGAGEEEEEGLPLEPGRTFRITATEGTWISVDVSPDGETLVFDLLGDLWTMPVEGGRATRLTSGMAFDGQPRYSPDGERIVFTSDRSGGENLWIIAADGSDTLQLTKGKAHRYQSPEWTPDGKYIVASRAGLRSGTPQLRMWHVDGGSGIQLIEEPERLKTLGPAFGPDERWLWFARRTGNWDYNADLPEYQLAVYDRETGERHTRSFRYGSGGRPTLSPDGRWLAYISRYEDETGIRLRELETGDERWLAYPVQHDDMESRASRDVYPGMSFTPDSEALIATYDGKLWRIPVNGSEPAEIPFTADVEIGLGPELDFDYPVDDAPTFVASQLRDAVPSPDGERLAFTVLDRLYVMEWPDGEPERVTEMEVTEAQPAWSPDGRWLAYATWSHDEGGHLYRVRADGSGDPERLTGLPGIYQEPAWSPDGERIVAIRGPARAYLESSGPRARGARDDLVWIPAAGGAHTVVAPAAGHSGPHFRSDEPRRIYLHHRSDGLVSMRFDGTDRKAHLKVTGVKPPDAERPPRADFLRIAPGGDLALAAVDRGLYVVTVPPVGGEAPTISVARPENASFPARKLTTGTGGEFPAWGADGRTVHWSLANAHFVYDLDAAEAAEAAEEAAEAEAEEEEEAEETEEEDEEPAYTPRERRIEVTVRRDIPEGTVVLRGARVVTMDGDRVIEEGDIVVEGARIAAVGPRGEVTVPEGARIIDVSGKTIVPGFVDTHAHLRPAWGVHKTQVWSYLANLAYGVTTTRDPQTGTSDVLTYADEVEAGRLAGPRVYSTGPGVFWGEQIRDLDHAREVLERYSEYFDTKTIKMYVAGNRQQRQWIIQAAREQRLMPTTEGSLNLKMNLTQIIDGYPGHEHSLPVYPLHDDVVRLVAESRTVYTPTLLVAYGGPWAENFFYSRERPHDSEKLRRFTPHQEVDSKTRRRGQWFMDEEHVFEDQAADLAKIVEAGGRAGVGSHGQLQGLGYHWELWAVASGGLSNHEALRVATLVGADAIGLDGDLGSVEAGKLADLVFLDGNPLADLRNTNTVRYVMKNGRLYDGDTLDEIWPEERRLEGLYWADDRPRTEAGIR